MHVIILKQATRGANKHPRKPAGKSISLSLFSGRGLCTLDWSHRARIINARRQFDLFIYPARAPRETSMPFLRDGGLQVYIYLGARSRQDAEYFSQKRVRSYTALHPLALLDALYYFFFGGLRFIFACNETRSALPCLTDTPGSSNWWCPMRLTTEKCHFSDDYVVVFADKQKKTKLHWKKYIYVWAIFLGLTKFQRKSRHVCMAGPHRNQTGRVN